METAPVIFTTTADTASSSLHPDTRPEVFFPFEWKVDTLDRMVNFEIVGHPIYNGIEIQGFCDQYRKGMLVFLTRTQTDLTDVYYESSLRNKLDSSLYGIGGGLGIWQELDPTKKHIIELDVSDDNGVEARLDFHDVDGRHIEVYLKDPTPRARQQQQRRRSGRQGPSSSSSWSEFLAPVGSAIVHPKHLLLVWMSQFDLFYRTSSPGRTSTNFIRIDNISVDTGHLPMEWFLRRRLIKVAKNLFIVMVNPVVSDNNEDGTNRQPVPETNDKDNTTNIRTVDDQGRLESLEAKVGNHSARMEFIPPFPNCNCIIDDGNNFSNNQEEEEEEGRFKITLDGTTVVTGGTWNVMKQQQREDRDSSAKESKAKTSTVPVSLDIDEGWIPGRSRISRLMRFVTWAAKDVFRQWPTTYRYTSAIWYDGESHQHWMGPKWERTSQQQRAEKYRSMMGTD
mmetsp:Transcript_34069/g.81941  ORF Transcript_34069/g.81941 Transcript_34069/m.81941 type:complete len:452 (+) Transcript_34069:449-1804(+)|eukprot:CAMPEP_0113516506 /NCGR_PEP_ID=MMETSP0014_2-20120614/41621_1 /TAXON_ID=2857 /ORGANISM="Nitzschia sp." /LENGTH=451 /DNA_ID=CAMNT_0000413359 /DNA_START=371 /DNA_END=1726 /DNA_ORIENTATION=+ /assembly_acc=CAM_ASM_000159